MAGSRLEKTCSKGAFAPSLLELWTSSLGEAEKLGNQHPSPLLQPSPPHHKVGTEPQLGLQGEKGVGAAGARMRKAEDKKGAEEQKEVPEVQAGLGITESKRNLTRDSCPSTHTHLPLAGGATQS